MGGWQLIVLFNGKMQEFFTAKYPLIIIHQKEVNDRIYISANEWSLSTLIVACDPLVTETPEAESCIWPDMRVYPSHLSQRIEKCEL